MLDEPTEGIQPSIIKDIERAIRALAATGEMSILLVEQYYDFARSLADQYLVMERGEIIARGRGADMEARGRARRCSRYDRPMHACRSGTRAQPGAPSSRSTIERRGGRTVLARRRHEGPLVVQKPLYPEGDAVCHTILVHPPGGIAGGDELVVDARVGAQRARAADDARRGQVVPLGGPVGAAARRDRRPAPAACVEWLPQETILFDGARARHRHWKSILHARRGRSSAGISCCLGRTGIGRALRARRVPVADAHHGATAGTIWFERGLDARRRPVLARRLRGLSGRTVFGTFVAARSAVRSRVWSTRAGARRADEGAGAVTHPPGVLVARYLGDSSEARATSYFQRIWRHVTACAAPASAARRSPRIWNT